MKKLLKNKKGFTLMEMLIVVAIIVILVAISIPTFSGSLDSAKSATDDANLRSAEAAAITAVMLDNESIDGKTYDLESGKFVDSVSAAYGESSANDGKVIKVTSVSGSDVTVEWVNK